MSEQVTTPQSQAAPVSPEVVQAAQDGKKPEGNPAKETKPDAKAEPAEKYEIKVNGKSKHVSREELIRLAQLSEAANERFESASQKERRINSLMSKAKDSPISMLMDPELGLTKDQIRAKMEDWYNKEFIEPETMTKEQRESRDLKEKLAAYEKADAERRADEQKKIDEKADAEYTEHFQKQIIDAIEANKLPKTKSMVKRIAFFMRQSLANGWDAPMELIIQKVKDDRKNEDSEINEYTYEDIVDRFGEDFVKKVIAENLKRLRDKRAANGVSSFTGKEETPREAKGSKITMREASKRLKEMRLGK